MSADKVGKFEQALKGEVGLDIGRVSIVYRGSGRVGSGWVGLGRENVTYVLLWYIRSNIFGGKMSVVYCVYAGCLLAV